MEQMGKKVRIKIKKDRGAVYKPYKRPLLSGIDLTNIKAFLKHPSVLVILCAVLLLILGGFFTYSILSSKKSDSQIKPNVDIVAEAESNPVDAGKVIEEASYEGKVDNDLIKNAEANKELSSTAILPYNEDTGFGYLNNCVFLGDSRTVGMVNFKYISDEDALAKVGIAHTAVEKTTFTQNSGKQYTVKQYLSAVSPKVAYVCYGVNGLDSISEEKYIESYTSLVDKIIEWAPKTNIVLMAIWPVDDNGIYKGKVKNEWIEKYNKFLLSLAEEKGIYYLDVDTVLKNDEGSIKEEYDSGDGLHYSSSAYKVILDYIVTHPVPGVPDDGEYKVHYVKPSKEYNDIVSNTAASEAQLTDPVAAAAAAAAALQNATTDLTAIPTVPVTTVESSAETSGTSESSSTSTATVTATAVPTQTPTETPTPTEAATPVPTEAATPVPTEQTPEVANEESSPSESSDESSNEGSNESSNDSSGDAPSDTAPAESSESVETPSEGDAPTG
ncbi:MAG: hypothetical protein K5931_00940 [Lachnospiraceae bacterium]|nr:hypothetical protein [Lachnospiraceae bacterium]